MMVPLGTLPPGLGAAEASLGPSFGLEWLLLAFAAAMLGVLLWMLLRQPIERLTFESVVCPAKGRRAEVFVRRTPDGAVRGLLRCSLWPADADRACDGACLRDEDLAAPALHVVGGHAGRA